jgi:hypothetical protein
MAIKLPNGSQIAIASTYGASKSMTAISNASAAVATLEASHGVIVSDILEVTSGWEDLEGRIVRASVVATNDVTFEAIDTTSTTVYPAGSGTGSVREITAWTNVTQILNTTGSPGEQQYYEYQLLSARRQSRVPTVRGASSLELSLADDTSQAWYAVVRAASDANTPTAMRVTLADGSLLFYNGYWSLSDVPEMTVNQAMTLACSFSLTGQLTRYAS